MATALAAVERDAFAAAVVHFGGMVDYLKSHEAGELTESEVERTLEQQIRELARQLIQAHLQTREPGEALGVVRGADGVERETSPWVQTRLAYDARLARDVLG